MLRVALILVVLMVGLGERGSFGQACVSPTGQPTIDQSFGTTSAPATVTDRTSYSYVTKNCPSDGEYTVADAVDGSCFGNTWHTLTEDHTPGDVRGNMMIVNAWYQPSEFYRQPLTGLCSGTTYEFSVWAINLLRPGQCVDGQLPKLTIRIESADGQVIRTLDLGAIEESATPTWHRYSALFTAPAVTEGVQVKLINSQGGCGNDLALDDIQLRACGLCSFSPAHLPDAFTPNNDGMNDVLTVFLRDAITFNIQIYDRWGTILFSSDSLTDRWDGTHAGAPCAAGPYAWVVTYQLTDPDSSSNTYVQSGRVMLLR